MDTSKTEAEGQAVDFFDVIAEPLDGSAPPFGQLFTRHDVAEQYARLMRQAGYEAEAQGPYETASTVADAMDAAEDHFRDPAIARARRIG